MKRFEHGGATYGHEGALDFSANLNPLGMPAGVRAALREAADSFDAYPDPLSRDLVATIAAREGVSADWVLACAGATDAITRICLALKPVRALVCAPCYSGYEQALEQAGAAIVRHWLNEARDFALDDSILARLSDGVDMAFLANPNNPTGLTVERRLLERFVAEADERGIVVVLDECFLDFTGQRSATDLLGRFGNLVIVKAFTKIYAMAGLRLGYLLCADAGLRSRFADMGQMWAVSAPAQVAGMAALEEDGFVERTRAYVAERRGELASALADLGLRVVPGQANYLMFQSPVPIYEPLLKRDILVRRCENYVGLDGRWFRVAIRTEQENARLVAALREVLS